MAYSGRYWEILEGKASDWKAIKVEIDMVGRVG